MKSSLQKLILLITIGLAVMFLAVWIYLLVTVLNRSEHISVLEEDVRTNSNNLNLLISPSTAKSLTKADTLIYFVKNGEESLFIEMLEKLCVDTGVMCEVKPVGLKLADGLAERFQKLQISISATGGFLNTTHFLSVVETLPYNSSIPKVDMSFEKGNNASTTSVWKLVIDLEVMTIK